LAKADFTVIAFYPSFPFGEIMVKSQMYYHVKLIKTKCIYKALTFKLFNNRQIMEGNEKEQL